MMETFTFAVSVAQTKSATAAAVVVVAVVVVAADRPPRALVIAGPVAQADQVAQVAQAEVPAGAA